MDSSKRKIIIDAEADILKKKIDHEELFKYYQTLTDDYFKQYTRLNLDKQRIEIEIAELQLEELKRVKK